MQIQMEITEKMKLYNVYRLCDKHINFKENIKVTHTEEINSAGTKKITVYTIHNWLELKNVLTEISKVPALLQYANECIQYVPDTFREEESIRFISDKYTVFCNKIEILYNKMQCIIELYESLKIETEGKGVDIKLPPCDDLKEYIAYLKDLDFIFSQCPFLQCDNEVLKFGSVDVGSNWLKLTVATVSTCLILNNIASLMDKALILRSHYITIQQQEELLKSSKTKIEMSEENINTFKVLKNSYMNIIIDQLEKESSKTLTPEERNRTEISLNKLIMLLDKGCEIYATLDSPEDVQALFPEIQSNLELPDSIIKYLEEKEEITE